jgi:hypothetical protein
VSRGNIPWTAVLCCAAVFVSALPAETFRYSVTRQKLLRDEPGELLLDESGLQYRAKNGKKFIRIAFIDIHKVDLSNPRVIRIETYDILKRKLTGRKEHVFRLTEGKFDEALTTFFINHSKRPVVGDYADAVRTGVELAAYHRHRLGGCHGKLLLSDDGIHFLTDHPKDSRTWRYSEIETIGRMNAYHFRVSTLAETYNFDLKEQLSERVYENSARRAYRLPQSGREQGFR